MEELLVFLCLCWFLVNGQTLESVIFGSSEVDDDKNHYRLPRVGGKTNVCDQVKCFQNQICEEYHFHNKIYPLCYNRELFKLLATTICLSGNECQNNGTCVNGRCSCPPHVHGLICETSFTPCEKNPCGNDQLCISVSGGGSRCQDLHSSFEETTATKTTMYSSSTSTSSTTTTTTFTSRTSRGVCTEHTCVGPRCRCVPSCKHEAGFYCVSDIGYIGKHCNIGPPVLQCEASAITMRVLRNFVDEFDERRNSTQLFVAGSVNNSFVLGECVAYRDGDWFVVTIPSPFTGCGSRISHVNNEIVYSNTLWVNRKSNLLYDIPYPIIDFNCSYEAKYSVSTHLKPVVDTIIPSLSAFVKRKLSVSLCKVSVCRNQCPEKLVVTEGADYTINEVVHLGLTTTALPFYQSSAFETEIMAAFLSCSQDRESAGRVFLINGCEDKNDLDVKVNRRNSASTCLSFRVPKMVGCTNVYIHFQVYWCLSTNFINKMCDDGKVYRQCQIDGVKKRSIPSRVSNDVDYHVFGPLRIVSSWQKISFLSDSGPVPIQHSQKPASIIIQPVAKQLKPKHLRWVLVGCGVILVVLVITLVMVVFCLRQNVISARAKINS